IHSVLLIFHVLSERKSAPWTKQRAETLIDAIRRKGTRDLTVVSNNAGAGEYGLAKLSPTGQVSRWIVSFIGNNKPLGQQYHEGKVAVELCPQGSIAERLRAAGAG